MKKKFILLFVFIFAITMAMPMQGFCLGMDKALENAIKIAKTKFTIPEDYKFTSSISTENNKKIFYLGWNSKDTMKPGSISVRVDENGIILGYSKYSQSDYVQSRKLPILSRQDAKVKADGYIKAIDASLPKMLRYEEYAQTSIQDASYYFTYYRIVNGIPYTNDRVTVTVNKNTGALQDYSRQWTDHADFPAVKNPISLKKAEECYSKNLGLQLIYKYTNTEDTIKVFAAYVPIYDDTSYGINAFTGERQRLSYNYYAGKYDKMSNGNLKSATAAASEVKLNPDEQKAVQEASKLITQEAAEKIARNSKFLNLTSEDKLENTSLSTDWPEKNKYVWSLNFNKSSGENSKNSEYTGVNVNAKTGVITSFYRNTSEPSQTKPKGDMAAARAQAEAFLAEYYPQYYKQLQYDQITSEGSSDDVGGEKNATYNFVYNRLVNGVPFPGNGVRIYYDNYMGRISSFTLDWFDISFPSVAKAIGVSAASQKLYKNVGLELGYKLDYIDPNKIALSMSSKIVPAASGKTALVYTLKADKPHILDANSGALLTYDGTAYKEAVKVAYTDIKGNAAEKQIKVLAENGIYLEGTQFKPSKAITQQDFLILLSKTLNYYGTVSPLTKKETDNLYSYLQQEGIVKTGEKAPSSAVTREDAVKFLIRALKYDKVADIKGIYNVPFKDKAGINQKLTGYVAIAAGLGIVDAKSAYFRPKALLTRGESAILIYNYLRS